jgi:hypothetical protein
MSTSDTEINWGYNCLTQGVHHGRPETIWNIPLLYAATMVFRRDPLQELVISRIYNDAMQMVEHWSEEDPELSNVTHRIVPEWADLVKELAEKRFLTTLQRKVGEISNYYKSAGWELEQQESARRVTENKLNPGYEPLHPHDTINMLCRIIGVSASIKASEEMLGK